MEPSAELLDWIWGEIERGESQASIALALHISVGTLSNWLNTPERLERSARARQASAEAWLDKGFNYLLQSLQRSSGIDSNAARALAQECARRAAIRNPAYREKNETKLEVGGVGGGPVRTLAATLTPEQAAAEYKALLGGTRPTL